MAGFGWLTHARRLGQLLVLRGDQIVERVERVKAMAATHLALTGIELFRAEPENGLTTRAAGKHRRWLVRV
ncbi:hypothetical protein FACS189488_06630 [Betaproteobacteria bacterium]|nr:hypothetical protein FACS189488_06630 [Betaproteobacteria bacterium]